MRSTPFNVLVLATYTGDNANVIRDYLFSFNRYSRHRFHYVFDCNRLDCVGLDRFDAILIFWSTYLLGDALAPDIAAAIADAPAVRMLFLQDEYRDVRAMNAVMDRLRIDHMFTCVEPDQHDTFYPRAAIPSLAGVHTVLTGYVPEYMAKSRFEPRAARRIDIGYRSRDVPVYLGDLGRAKCVIADRFRQFARDEGFTHDISVREEDRIYGRDWVRFLCSCRFSLGTPSGASVVDFTGEIRRSAEAYIRDHPGSSYEDLRRRFWASVDGATVIETSSPRIFEAAALGSALVLMEGRYLDGLEPDRHFIQVGRDFSNLDEVAAKMRDETLRQRLVSNTYRDLIASGQYSYRSFVQRFDTIVDSAIGERRGTNVSHVGFIARRYIRYGQCVVPWRHRSVRLPSLARPIAILATIKQRRQPPLPSHTDGALSKALAGFLMCWNSRCLRRAIARRPLRPFGLPLRALLKDAYRLDLIRRANVGEIETTKPFRVVARLDATRHRLLMISVPSDDAPACTLPRTMDVPTIDDAMRSIGVREILWDHSRVGETLRYRLRRTQPWRLVHFDSTGTFSLSRLAAVAEGNVEAAAELIAAACANWIVATPFEAELMVTASGTNGGRVPSSDEPPPTSA